MRRQFAIVLTLFLLGATCAQARMADRARSHLGFSVAGAYSHLFLGKHLLPSAGFAKPSHGGGADAALFYELQYVHFLFRIGFGMSYTVNTNRFESPDYNVGIAEYPTMTYHYDFHHFREKTTYGIGYVPVLLGGLFDKFFFLVGAKIGVLPFSTFTQPVTQATIWATDNDVIDPLEDIYTHEMKDYSFVGQRVPMAFNRLNIMGSLEVGINFDRVVWSDENPRYMTRNEKSLRYRLSFFVDYGFSNLLSYRANPVPDPATGDAQGGLYAFNGVSDITPFPMYGYAAHKNAVLNNMMFGVKFAFMYELPQLNGSCRCE